MRRLASFAVAIACAAGLAAQAPIVSTVLNNGSTSNHYDMVILGDGYRAVEQARFNSDVQAFLTGLFLKAPYSMLSGYFNVHTVFRASVDSGATHPDVTPPLLRNTAYGATYNTGGTARCLYITNASQALADAALAPANESRILVMVNDSRYGGCAGQFAVSYNGASMIEVQSHELGHAAAGLADEYDYPNGNYTGSEPGQPNITANALGQKWSQWWGVEGVGAFQGAGYYLTGLYRPRSDCLMRNLGITLCPVCREQITRSINLVADAIESPSPAASSITVARPTTQTFSFTNLVPPANNPTITWIVDGVVVSGATTTSFVFDPTTHSIGTHTVLVQVRDNTPQVRVDPNNSMVHARNWSVTVTDPSVSNVRVISPTVTPQAAPLGTEVDVAVTVVNDGPGVANNIEVEHFISTDGSVQTTDVYLGRSVVPTLAAGQQTTITRRVALPKWLHAQFWLLLASADRNNSILESNEADNTATTVLIAQAPACGATLDYRDDLLYPRNVGSISIASGGTLRPTIASPCAAGGLYAILWGCSGTSPGTQLAPGVTLPLNIDSCSLLVVDNINGAQFQGFLGFLDASGVGRATLSVPPGLSLLPSTGHLAAATFDTNFAFTGVTNAIGFDLQ